MPSHFVTSFLVENPEMIPSAFLTGKYTEEWFIRKARASIPAFHVSAG